MDMDRTPFGLLEFGSNSLKFYLVGKPVGGQHPIDTHKFPWRVAHDYYRAGATGGAADEEILTSLRDVQKVARGLPLDGMLAVATGVFRELSTIDQIVGRVMSETGVRIRVISGSDEAQLMARGFREYSDERPVLFCDLGGATMEWAYLKDEDRGKWGASPWGRSATSTSSTTSRRIRSSTCGGARNTATRVWRTGRSSTRRI